MVEWLEPDWVFDTAKRSFARGLLRRPQFDLDADLDLSGEWSIGVVVGPSGSGKTSIGRQIFGDPAPFWTPEWPADAPIIDAIAPEGDFNALTGALGSVGLAACRPGCAHTRCCRTARSSAPISRAWSAMRPSARSWTSSHRSLTGRVRRARLRQGMAAAEGQEGRPVNPSL